MIRQAPSWVHQELFYQLFESFVPRLVINTKAPNGVNSFLTLYKGKNDMLLNYNKRYWELYNKNENCLEELTVVSYKLRLTLGEKLWVDLTLNPLVDLHDLMSRVEMFARLEDNVTQGERALGSSYQGDGKFMKSQEKYGGP